MCKEGKAENLQKIYIYLPFCRIVKSRKALKLSLWKFCKWRKYSKKKKICNIAYLSTLLNFSNINQRHIQATTSSIDAFLSQLCFTALLFHFFFCFSFHFHVCTYMRKSNCWNLIILLYFERIHTHSYI